MTYRVFVAGDPVTDDFLLFLPPLKRTEGEDWQRHKGFLLHEAKGGVDLTLRALRELASGGPDGVSFSVEGCAIPRTGAERGLGLRSLVELACVKPGMKTFDAEPDLSREPVTLSARVKHARGYSLRPITSESAMPDLGDMDPFDIVVLNDAGGGLRKSKRFASGLAHLRANKGLVIHKRHCSLSEPSRLQKALNQVRLKQGEEHRVIPRDRCVLHVQASDLRQENIRLGSTTGWAQAVADLKDATAPTGFLHDMLDLYGMVIVQFDAEGAAVLTRPVGARNVTCTLLYDPARAEGDIDRQLAGDVVGKMNAFLCAIVASVAERRKEKPKILNSDVLRALAATRNVAKSAYSLTIDGSDSRVDPLLSDLPSMEEATGQHGLQAKRIVLSAQDLERFEHCGDEDERKDLARRIVEQGPEAVKSVPHARFGKLLTIDAAEIASYREIERSILSYIENKDRNKPLSIGVFGAPGSGKSFGIKEIVQNLPILVKEFNLSESSAEDLPGYFHELRDVMQEGKLPLCFFDEFDRNEYELLARFLAPMQDGTFRDRGRTHPIGRAILVFAGGTSTTLKDLRQGVSLILPQSGSANGGQNDKQAGRERKAAIKQKKIPDFLSRLEGVLEIRGLQSGDRDQGCFLRRATILRSLLERHAREAVINGAGRALVEKRLLDALLFEAKYRSGARSMEKLVIMSGLTGAASGFSVSDLPSMDLLSMHVKNPKEFMKAART